MGIPLKWSTACPDWEERIVKAQTLIPFAPLFQEKAVEAMEVFDNLIATDVGDGTMNMGQICRSWIRDFVSQIFGSYDPETGIRHIQEYFLLISKKNGKSTTAAAIMLTALILNWRKDAEFIILSPTIEIAKNSYAPAAAMVRADPELSEMLHVQDHTRTITHLATGATLKVVAADAATVGGKKAVGVLVDELWIFGKNHNADDMLREAIGGLASRPEGFVIYLTTQSNEPPAGVFKTRLEYARGVRDGLIDDPNFLPCIYEFPMDMLQRDEHRDPANFYVTNPNLDDHPLYDGPGMGSVLIAFIQREWSKAEQEGEESVRGFLAKHLNVEIGLNLRADRWPGADWWEYANKIERVTISYILENCEVVTGGIDGGGLDDLLGVCVLGRMKDAELVDVPAWTDDETGEIHPESQAWVRRWVMWQHAYCHPTVFTRRKDIKSKLVDLKKEGKLTLCNRVGEDSERVAKVFKRIHDAGLLYQIGFDRNAIGGIQEAIVAEDIEQDKLVKVNQGPALAAAIVTTERKLAEGVLVHDGNGLGNWTTSNAKMVVRGNSAYVTKQVSGTAKIDPLIALFNAVDIMSTNPEAQNDSYNSDNMVICG